MSCTFFRLIFPQESRFRDDVIPFLTSIVDRLEIREDKTRVGLVTFDWDENLNIDRTELQFRLGQYLRKEDIKHAMRTLPYYGGRTNTADGLRVSREQLFNAIDIRPGVQRILIVVTDGQSNVNSHMTLPEAVLARESGIHVIVASIENDPANLELKGISSRPHTRNIINVQRYGNLPDILDTIIDAACDGRYIRRRSFFKT